MWFAWFFWPISNQRCIWTIQRTGSAPRKPPYGPNEILQDIARKPIPRRHGGVCHEAEHWVPRSANFAILDLPRSSPSRIPRWKSGEKPPIRTWPRSIRRCRRHRRLVRIAIASSALEEEHFRYRAVRLHRHFGREGVHRGRVSHVDLLYPQGARLVRVRPLLCLTH